MTTTLRRICDVDDMMASRTLCMRGSSWRASTLMYRVELLRYGPYVDKYDGTT
jgi:hypothetical protein